MYNVGIYVPCLAYGVQKQLRRVDSLLPPFCKFWGLNSCHQSYTASPFTHCAILPAWVFLILFLFLFYNKYNLRVKDKAVVFQRMFCVLQWQVFCLSFIFAFIYNICDCNIKFPHSTGRKHHKHQNVNVTFLETRSQKSMCHRAEAMFP